MYNAALVMSEQLKAVGVNAKLLVLDWPATIAMQEKSSTGWNWFFTGYGTNPVLGPVVGIRNFAAPYSVYKPKTPEDADKPFNAAFNDMVNGATPEIRKEAFARAQKRILDEVWALPFGSLTKVQAVRANVQNFRPYRIPRLSNVSFSG
jgi:peptide/nickel transport system substrate-binding protein